MQEIGCGAHENPMLSKLFQNLKVYFKKQCTIVICNNMDEPQNYFAEWKKASGNVY